MTRVGIAVNGNDVQIIIAGHAGHDERGKDIVCAGASALANLIMNYAKILAEDGVTDNSLVQEYEEFVHVYVDTKGNKAIEGAVEAFRHVIEDMAAQYPENIQLNII